jgi:hypothetical protein
MSKTKIVAETISRTELRELAHEFYGDVIKAVVDVEKELLGVGGEFHSEIERLLIEEYGSKRADTWGINLLLDRVGDEFVEFDSMINLKPALGNKTRNVGDENVRKKILEVVRRRITP